MSINIRLKILGIIVAALKFLVSKFASDYHLARNPIHTRSRRKKEADEKPEGVI